jgi:HD-GYP domain-containing protein (c-di-GMP phosphodiesterase class II)
MQIIKVNQLVPGQILGRSLFSMDGNLLLAAWTELDEHYIERIKQLGLTSVYIHVPGTEDAVLHEIISDRLRSLTHRTVYETHESIQNAIRYWKMPPNKMMMALDKGTEFDALVDTEKLVGNVQSILDEIFDQDVETIDILFIRSTNSFLVEHSLDVAVYTILLGKEYGFSRKLLLELGMAALMHDVGKLAFPQLIEKSMDIMSPDEIELLKEHPVLSVKLLERSSDRFFHARTAILYHHEHQDGSGYPLGLRGFSSPPDLSEIKLRERIYPLAEILAVTNTYDNYLFSPHAEPTPPSEALSLLMDDSSTLLNKHMVRTWARILNLYPPGSTVVIEQVSSDLYRAYIGFKGVVVNSQPGRLPQPVIVLIEDNHGERIDPLKIDFSKDPNLQIKLVL